MSQINVVDPTPGAEYRVVSRWTFTATRDEIAEVFREPEQLPAWWPAAFLAVTVDRPGGLYDVGQVATLHTKGWLPYTLTFHCRVTESNHPHGFTIAVDGDFEGHCVNRLKERNGTAELEFDWRVRVRKPVVRMLSYLFKPVFVANHLWVMKRGYQSLGIELERRRAARAGVAAALPRPPGPTFRFLATRPLRQETRTLRSHPED